MSGTSAALASSRQECMPSIGEPTSTVDSPSRIAVSGPMVDPHGRSARVTKCYSGTPASAHRAANQPPLRASVA